LLAAVVVVAPLVVKPLLVVLGGMVAQVVVCLEEMVVTLQLLAGLLGEEKGEHSVRAVLQALVVVVF
jgi:hypothetical protein